MVVLGPPQLCRLSKRPSLQLLTPLDTTSMNLSYNMTKVLDHLYVSGERRRRRRRRRPWSILLERLVAVERP